MKNITRSIALIAIGLTSLSAANIVDITKDALINTTSFTVAGTFGKYDFEPKGDNNKFDWAFTTSNGDVYQLRGAAATEGDVFGWAKAPAGTVSPTPAWYMFQVDVDNDGEKGKFDWVLLAAQGSAAYKLDGVAADGGFAYAGPIDIDYKIDGTKITTGAKGTLDDTTPTEDCSNGCSTINANNLPGYTVFIEDSNGYGVEVQEYIYIFENDNKVKVILNRKDGGQIVHDGTYKIKGVVGFKVVDIHVVLDESTSSGYTLMLDDDLMVKEDQLGYKVTKILPNDKNNVVIKENTATNGALTVNSVDDVKGYTITSNVAHIGTSGATMELSIAFNCDGTFEYTINMNMSGYQHTNTYSGDELYIDTHFDTNRIAWHYVDEDGDRTGDSLDTDVNNQILEGACWISTKSDGTCSNDLYVKSVTHKSCN
jgi:hypothetical protein